MGVSSSDCCDCNGSKSDQYSNWTVKIRCYCNTSEYEVHCIYGLSGRGRRNRNAIDCLYICSNCGDKGRITFEFDQDGKNCRFGYYAYYYKRIKYIPKNNLNVQDIYNYYLNIHDCKNFAQKLWRAIKYNH